MTTETKPESTGFRRIHASVLRWRRKTQTPQSNDSLLLNEEDFRFAADCERMRVDRNHSVLSLLLVRLHNSAREDIAFFSRVLEGRLRITDTPGLLDDGRIAILLPDTPAEGAWKVAADISEVYPAGPGRPECEVLVYSEDQRDEEPRDFDDESDHGQHDDSQPRDPQEKVAASSADNGSNRTNEFFFR